MKRVYIYILLCVALLSSATLTAQSISDELVYNCITGYMTSESNIDKEAMPSKNIQQIRWKHNIRIGYGAPSITSWMFTHDGFPGVVCCDLGPMQQTLRERIHNSRYHESAERYLHSLYAEYTTSINPWFSIGAKCTFAAKWFAEYNSQTNELFARHNAYDIGALLNMRFEWLRHESVQMYSTIGVGLAAHFERAEGRYLPMFDATFVGLSVGRSFYGFVELGGGISGSLRGGFGVRF